MCRLLAFSLLFVMLLQVVSRPVIVANYELNKERITALFCENKDLPQLQCNGKCHLAKQLEKQEQSNQSQERTAEVSTHFMQAALYAFVVPTFFVVVQKPASRYSEAAYLSPRQPLFQPPKI